MIGTASRMPLENTSPDSAVNRRISILVLSRSKEQEIRLEDTQAQRADSVLSDINLQNVQGYTDGHE
ncbi:chemotaxis protein MotB [Enterobacter cloacae]|uniref:Chemotaxis protein MotB n=1 Tax=Enterobacter cloacae TaxID=550 RepID=A0A377LXS4_ENTCL|nr:chemotaxis protein MotB [Enterobacter cloacae]